MTYMQWSDEFSVNVRELDEQHKQLVVMINKLHEALLSNKGGETQGTILRDVITFAAVHFGTEEKYMQQFTFPSQAGHRAEHDKFSAKAAELKKRMDEGGYIPTPEVPGFLKEWLKNHILCIDKHYADHFNARGLT